MRDDDKKIALNESSILMNRLNIVRKFLQRGEIECRSANTNRNWMRVLTPSWDWERVEYRIKPEPEEFYINKFSDGTFGAKHKTERSAMSSSGVFKTFKCVELIDKSVV